jgi:hypothetical protein
LNVEWQGKWYGLEGSTPEYPNLASVTGYGTVTGLKGANCRHDFYPVIPGVSEHSYTSDELKKIDPPPKTFEITDRNGITTEKTLTYYEQSQRQRAYERTIRARKRDLAASDGNLSAISDKNSAEYKAAYADFAAMSLRLKRTREAYEEFSTEAGMLTRNERTQAYGFSRSVSQKAAWARKNYQKELDKYKEVRYNKDGTVVVTDDFTTSTRNSLPPKYKPNAVADIGKDGKITKRYFYDENGIAIKRLDNTDHGNRKLHPYGNHGEHMHNYIYKNGKWTSGDGRPLTTDEIKENGDII